MVAEEKTISLVNWIRKKPTRGLASGSNHICVHFCFLIHALISLLQEWMSRTYTGLQTVGCCFTHACQQELGCPQNVFTDWSRDMDSCRDFTSYYPILLSPASFWMLNWTHNRGWIKGRFQYCIKGAHIHIVYMLCPHSPVMIRYEQPVTWVEHTEVVASLPNQTSGFAFGAEWMAAWLERYCEKTSHMNATHSLEIQGIGTYILIDMHLYIYLNHTNLDICKLCVLQYLKRNEYF